MYLTLARTRVVIGRARRVSRVFRVFRLLVLEDARARAHILLWFGWFGRLAVRGWSMFELNCFLCG